MRIRGGSDLAVCPIPTALSSFTDEEMGAAILEGFSGELAEIGTSAGENNLRLVLHPDHFVKLKT